MPPISKKAMAAIPRWKKYRVTTGTRSFTVEWVRDESELLGTWKGDYIQDTFRFNTMKDYKDFHKTAFYKKNGYNTSCAFHAAGPQCTWFINEAMYRIRKTKKRYTPFPE